MGEEFVAVIKLVSGEEILASVCVDETGEEPIIIAHTPVTMKMINKDNMALKLLVLICLLMRSSCLIPLYSILTK